MEVFQSKTISEQHSGYVDMKVMRMRTSEGFGCISVEYDGQRIEFSSKKLHGDYEQAALSFAEMIEKIASNPCQLPTD